MILNKIFNIIGSIVKFTYKYQDNSYSNIKYLYFFFYQRILMFNFFIPWPVHFTSYITGKKNITFGSMTSPGSAPFQYIQGENGIILGNNVQIAPGVQLISANHDFDNFEVRTREKPIEIGSNVWIGSSSVILPGVTIGDNVIIGAGSIVTKSISSNCVAAGNPCKKIRNKEPYKIY